MTRSTSCSALVTLTAGLALLGAGLVAAHTASAAPEGCLEDRDVDAGLVLDRSGSMSGDRIDVAKQGAQNLVDRMTSTDQSGLVSYSSSPSLDQEFTFNHSATSDAIADLTAGGSTATGDAIDLSHQDFLDNGRSEARPAMVVLTDGFTNTGADPVTEAQEAKDDGIDVYAIGVGSSIDEPELREIASDPVDRYFYHAENVNQIEPVFDDIAEDLRRNDTQTPSLAPQSPEEGHLYLAGEDQGPGTGTFDDRATLRGNTSFHSRADDNCYLEEIRHEVPGTGFTHAVNATNVSTDAFPARTVDPGNYTLDITATDWVGLQDDAATGLHVPEPEPPVFVDGPCATGETVTGFEGVELSFPVVAESPVLNVTVELALLDAPAGVELDDDGPASPVTGEVTWPDPDRGNYTIRIQATDSVGYTATCSIPLEVVRPPGESRVVGAWAATTTPESLEHRTRGVHLTDMGADEHRTTRLDNSSLDLYVDQVDERGRVAYDPVEVTSHGYAQLSDVRLFDGLVTVETMVHEANATWDVRAQEGELANVTRRVTGLEVDGQPVHLEDETGPVNVSLPGDGFVRLFEQDIQRTDDGLAYRSNLLHAHAPDVYGGEEVVLGEVFLEVPNADGRDTQPRAIAEQDDADSGRDAGGEDGEPVHVDDGLYDGTFAPGDVVDRYTLEAQHGEKIEITLEPGKRLETAGGQLNRTEDQTSASPPSAEAELPSHRIQLFDPDDELRATSILSAYAAQSVEINAPVDGTWTVEIERLTPFDQPGEADFDEDRYSFYSFETTVTPVPLLPQNDALGGADAPPDCQRPDDEIPEIVDGQWPGVVREQDFRDVYRFHADVGDLVTATLKPGETADGVAMDLYLYDRDCNVLAVSSLGGTYSAKGLPEATVQLPSDYTGTYYLAIERVNGVGNHHVTLSVRDPMPGLPTNDARTGQDASDDPANPTQAPPLAFQGTLPEEDPRDAYALELVAEERAWIAVEMSALSRIDATLLGPQGQAIQPRVAALDGTFVWDFTPTTSGEHTLVLEPWLGGGDYTVSWGQTASEPLTPAVQSAGLSPASTSP
jgi:uncharacterized protein YegL